MDPRAKGSMFHGLPHAFVNRKGKAIMINTLDDETCQQLIDMYLAFQPRNSFQGLPPVRDSACIEWVQHMIRNGINLVALSFREGVVGHTALFPIDNESCENLVVVRPSFQNTGIGTELTRCCVHLAHEIGFETIRLSVEARNVRARHVYKKCGFAYLDRRREGEGEGEVEMELDLKRYREAVSIRVSQIMNRNVLCIRQDQPCRRAMEIFLDRHVGSLPVVDREGRLVGIISKSDLMLPSQIERKVSDIFTREVVTVQETCPIANVIRTFQSRKIRSIPVIDPNQKLVGIVGREDILNHYATLLPEPPPGNPSCKGE